MGLAGLALETLGIVDAGRYTSPSGRTVDIGTAVAEAIAGTRLYDPDQLAALVAAPGRDAGRAKVEVTGEGTAEAGARLVAEGETDVAVLNFASARRVGGGFLGGAQAQEEELCRASALYRCLETARAYYEANRAQRSALYTDRLIWSPAVPFFRDPRRALLETPFRVGVVTAPAPNTGAVHPDEVARIPETFRRRAAMVLAVAEANGCGCVVLGAWGCGAFQGDPVVAADAFGVALEGRFARSFRRVVFGILAPRDRDAPNVAAFRARFGA